MRYASRTGILTVFLPSFVVMVACLASPSVWIAWSADLAQPAVSSSVAEEPPEQHGVDPQCRAELQKLCEGIQPGGGRLRKCVQENVGKLSPACQRQVQERVANAGREAAIQSACEPDIKQFCANVQPGGGRVIRCLQDHSKEVSPGCHQVLEEREPRKKMNRGGS
jgi:hypothetical protein